MNRKIKVYKKPFLSAILIMILFGVLYLVTATIADTLFKIADPTANADVLFSIASILGSLLALLIFFLRYKKDLQHFFTLKNAGKGFILGISIIAVAFAIFITNCMSGAAFGSLSLALILGIAPGISEEIIYRIIPLAFVKNYAGEKKTAVAHTLILTSAVFGLIHGANVFAGANPISSFIQVIYSFAIGLLFGGIYLRTETIWTIILLHAFLDVMNLVFARLQQSGGVLTSSVDVSSIVFILILTVIIFINAIIVYRKNKKDNII